MRKTTVTLDSEEKQCRKKGADGEKLKNKFNFTIGKKQCSIVLPHCKEQAKSEIL